MKKEEDSEYRCSECQIEVKDDDEICPNCGADLSEIEIIDNKEENEVTPKFNALNLYGQIISGVGWLIMASGILFIISGETLNKVVNPMLTGVILLFVGLGVVATGQIYSLFVSIEKNIREINHSLKTSK